jgi:choline dehydrogenase
VERQRLSLGDPRRVREAAQQAGIPATDDFNRGDNEGVGYFEVNQRAACAGTRPRPSCARPPRPTCTLWTDAQAQRLTVRDADGALRCTGVEVLPADGTRGSRCARARGGPGAGAIGSPQLLQLSGIGPAALLQAHGIEPRHDAARRRREPAGPPADPRGLRGARCAR